LELRAPDVTVVRAAGGVVWRSGPGNSVEYVVVHRPAYDDWTFPKGKVDPGETEEEAALREVAEETGMRCRLLRPLGTTSYLDRKGRAKVVYYYLMKAVSGRFTPNTEIDEVRWLTVGPASELLTYKRDATLFGALADSWETTG
jgi:8-oxo-dGTP pyrophosphatase MutT (NUDIX family)